MLSASNANDNSLLRELEKIIFLVFGSEDEEIIL